MAVAAILPARNEEESVARVVSDVLAVLPEARVIVVDDASADATADVARRAGATVVRCSRRGYGYAARAGTDAATGADVYVYLDADGSMPASEVPRLLAPVTSGAADIVIGSRRLSPGVMPWHQRLANRVIAARLRRRGVRVAELGPFRAVRASTLDAMSLPGSRFAWPAEMLVRAAAAGARVTEVAVVYAPRRAGRSKVGGSVRGTLLATWDIGRVLLRRRPA